MCQPGEIDHAEGKPTEPNDDRGRTQLAHQIQVYAHAQQWKQQITHKPEALAPTSAVEVADDAQVHCGEPKEGTEVDEGGRHFEREVQTQQSDYGGEQQVEHRSLGLRAARAEELLGQSARPMK